MSDFMKEGVKDDKGKNKNPESVEYKMFIYFFSKCYVLTLLWLLGTQWWLEGERFVSS